MFRENRVLKVFLSVLTLLSLNLAGLTVPARATDLVPSDDLSGGASVFVFRESRKKPQEKGAYSGSRSAGAGGRARRDRVKSQIAANRRKKAAAAKARQTQLARARARERNAKLKLSNTLTARAETLLEKGDIDAATTNFREALKANPKNADASTGLSEALTAKGIETAGENQNAAAVPFLEEAVKLNSRNDIAYAKLGEIHDAAGRNEIALTNYEKALAIDPEFTSLYLPVGLAYVESGDVTKADNYLAKAEAAGLAGSEAKFARAELLSKQNKNPEAIAAFDSIIQVEPQNAEAYYQRGVVYGRMNDAEKSVASYKEAVRVDPAMAAAWFDLGVTYYNAGDYKNALAAYKEVVRIDSGNAHAHANLASVYRQLEQYPEANAEYKQAEVGIKNNPDLYSEWGFCLGKTNEWDKAVARLETAEDLSPTPVDRTNVGWGYYNAAQADKAAKNEVAADAKLEKGKESLQLAVKEDPNFDAAYMNLGATHNQLGEHEEAVAALDKAVTLRSDWVIALNQLGMAYRGTNNLSMALTQFNRVVTIDGNNVMGLFNLGSAQYANGDKKDAKKTQARLKKLNPALADQLGNIIAGALIDEGKRQIRNKIRIPGLPF